MKTEVATYKRTATLDQFGENTMELQDKEHKEFCEEHNLKIVRSFFDLGKSGNNFEREGWKGLIQFLQSGEHNIKYLVVTSPDRIGRSFSTISEAYKLKNMGVQVICTRKSAGLSDFEYQYLVS